MGWILELRMPQPPSWWESVILQHSANIHFRSGGVLAHYAMLVFAGDVPIVTDDLPLVEFTGPMAVDMMNTPADYLEITRYAQSITPHLQGGAFSPGLLEALDAHFAEKKRGWDNARRLAAEREKLRDPSREWTPFFR